MLLGFRRLRSKMVQQGLFHSSKAYYAWKMVSLLGMYMTVATILWHGGNTWLSCFAAAFLLATCWQQTGWLSHDFLHHQVFKNRKLNTALGYVLGDVFQGFSVDWWKNKHNKHHAVPNECSEGAEPIDPGALLVCKQRTMFSSRRTACDNSTLLLMQSYNSCLLHHTHHNAAKQKMHKLIGLQILTRCLC
jgi:fatty acid desaturase